MTPFKTTSASKLISSRNDSVICHLCPDPSGYAEKFHHWTLPYNSTTLTLKRSKWTVTRESAASPNTRMWPGALQDICSVGYCEPWHEWKLGKLRVEPRSKTYFSNEEESMLHFPNLCKNETLLSLSSYCSGCSWWTHFGDTNREKL